MYFEELALKGYYLSLYKIVQAQARTPQAGGVKVFDSETTRKEVTEGVLMCNLSQLINLLLDSHTLLIKETFAICRTAYLTVIDDSGLFILASPFYF
ncbi:MAG: hypothetical protein WAM42_03740 [Candidatus Nitrosopolaris sp.]